VKVLECRIPPPIVLTLLGIAMWALLGPVLFVLYITRFQIVPEERVLATMFGGEFTSYASKVRRWL
jgi:protein-S-isoprenylcysteine O-methyltransferase Ste14